MKKFKIIKGTPYPLGAKLTKDGINFSMVNCSEEECGIILYRKGIEQQACPSMLQALLQIWIKAFSSL